ncbi:essential MCU regulator, mitochondrial [Agrilus planipennis]|uniref:Essential MCU regulator, mitochondrial n=1 Tax=Agrilus planipennis TaxID=224129 RepID=A0A7F5RMS6_AGRPL|nr:essential MCU regulator, mitochondrial [Agrilus planipennis]
MSLTGLLRKRCFLQKLLPLNSSISRTKVTTRSGGILPEPHRTSFGIIGIILTVIPGLLIGAQISKTIANFLEENDLFVPSDDDDDDD